MAAAKSAKYPYQWADGTWHSIPKEQHQANVAALAKPGSPAASSKEVLNPLPRPLALPPDADFENQMGALEQERTQALSGADAARTSGLADYGFTETNGALAFDPNNPFSKASLLKRNYDTSRARSAQTMGSTGGLYTGAFQTQQDIVNRGQLQDEDALQKSLSSFLLQNTDAHTRARNAYELGSSQAAGDRTSRALSNPLYDPTAGIGPAPSPASTGTSAPAAGSVGGVGKPATASKGVTIKAGPGVKPTKTTTVKKSKKGRTVTYTTTSKGP